MQLKQAIDCSITLDTSFQFHDQPQKFIFYFLPILTASGLWPQKYSGILSKLQFQDS